jgi:hypothetical protein
MRVTGRVKGPSSETTEQSVKFVTKSSYYFLPRFGALPSYSPWIEYDLVLQARSGGSICDVTVVYSAKRILIDKNDLIVHLLSREIMNEEEKKLYRTALRRLLKNVPDEIKSLDDIEFNVDPSRTNKIIFAIGKEWNREREFFDLLTIFPAGFLNQFTSDEILDLKKLWELQPWAYCFWDKAINILVKCGFSRKALSMHPKWACVRDDLFADDAAPMRFLSDYPILSANVLIRNKCSPVSPEILREALRLYTQGRRFFYSRGQTSFYVSKEFSPPVIFFLCKEHVLRRALGDMGGNHLFTTNKDELIEVRLALALSKQVKHIRLVNCPYYNREFAQKFSLWYEKQVADQCCLMSANSSSSSYISELTHLKFSYGNKPGAASTIVIDRAHKISPNRLLEILSNSTCKIEIRLHLFGDLMDHGVNCFRGGGRLFNDLERSGRFTLDDWTQWGSKDPMRLVYSSLQSLAFADLSIYNAKHDDDFGVIITGKYKTKKQTKRERIIFCSNEADRRRTVQHIVRIMDRTPHSDLYIGQRIQVMETDRIGEITKAWELSGGSKGRELQRRDSIESWRKPYVLMIDNDKTVRSDIFTIERADVCLIRKYAGRPFDEGICVVGKTTTKKDLLAAVKYCLKKIIFVFIDGTTLSNLKEENDAWSSDLITKIMKIRKGF